MKINIKKQLFWEYIRNRFGKITNTPILGGVRYGCPFLYICDKHSWKKFKKRHKIVPQDSSHPPNNCVLISNPFIFLKNEKCNLAIPISVIDKFVKKKDVLLHTFENGK